MVMYADVVAVRKNQLCEVLFRGTLEECKAYQKDNFHTHTSTPTCPFVDITREQSPRNRRRGGEPPYFPHLKKKRDRRP